MNKRDSTGFIVCIVTTGKVNNLQTMKSDGSVMQQPFRRQTTATRHLRLVTPRAAL